MVFSMMPGLGNEGNTNLNPRMSRSPLPESLFTIVRDLPEGMTYALVSFRLPIKSVISRRMLELKRRAELYLRKAAEFARKAEAASDPGGTDHLPEFSGILSALIAQSVSTCVGK